MKGTIGFACAGILATSGCDNAVREVSQAEPPATIRFLDPSGGPIRGGRVFAMGAVGSDSAGILRIWRLGEDSRIEAGTIPEAATILVARSAGISGALRNSGGWDRAEVVLRPGAGLSGVLELQQGDPPLQSWIRLPELALASNPSVSGTFGVDSVPTGRWRVVIGTAHPGYAILDTTIDFEPGVERDLGKVVLPYSGVRIVRGLQVETPQASPLARLRWSGLEEAASYRIWRVEALDTGIGKVVGITADTTWTDSLFPALQASETLGRSVVYRIQAQDAAGRTGKVWAGVRVDRISPFHDSAMDPGWKRVDLPTGNVYPEQSSLVPFAGGFVASIRGFDDWEEGMTGPFGELRTLWIDSTGSQVRVLETDSLAFGPAIAAFGILWWVVPTRDSGMQGYAMGMNPDGSRIPPIAIPHDPEGSGFQQMVLVLRGDTLQVSTARSLVVDGAEFRLVTRFHQDFQTIGNLVPLRDAPTWSIERSVPYHSYFDEQLHHVRPRVRLVSSDSAITGNVVLPTDRALDGAVLQDKILLWGDQWLGWTRLVPGAGLFRVVYPGILVDQVAIDGARIAILDGTRVWIGKATSVEDSP